MRTTVRVIQGRLAESEPHRTSAIEAAYQHFRLDKQGSLVSPKTLQHYEWTIRPFLRWLDEEHPEVLRFEQLSVEMVRQYRVDMSQRLTTRGRVPQPATLNDLHRLLMTFLRWAEDEGYAVDPRMRRLKAPRVPLKEATVFHIAQLRVVLGACNPERPQEELIVRMLVGSGIRAAELCGLAVRGPDGLPDLMLDSLDRGRVELRVRWDAGAKGKKSRRVPITPKLAAVIKRYRGAASRPCAGADHPSERSRAVVHAVGYRPAHGPHREAGRLSRACACLPAHVRHGGLPGGLESGAAPSGDGSCRLCGAAPLCALEQRAGSWPASGVGKFHRHGRHQ